ncbi:MAG TPA: Smr/MutS family protein [Sandaracinaceae bacterium LLY-WYZ-13_1]|nr:Smr/MutS family protein [Sandaracinaceae bacterium LLY-WYZ-13_1]
MSALDKARHDLEWDRVVEAVAARCTGPLAERLEALPIADSHGEARVALDEAREAFRLNELGAPLPLEGIREIRRSLDRVAREGALEGSELRDVASTLGAARALRRFLSRNRDEAPALHAACSTDPTLDDLQEELLGAVEPDGTLSDSASPDLGRLRTEVANLRARIVGRLEQMLVKHADVVQDRFHTLREGRYVLPIRTDAHEKIPGIVHGTSSSGATVFVEPRAIVNQGNRLKMAQGQLEREESRILGILAGRLRDRLSEVRAVVEALDRADLRHAAARLAKDLNGVIPELEPEPTLALVDARHPLLVLDGLDVVPNDLSLASGRALVLSGPNAGGKTVALKVLGLAALMARAGLPLPAAEGSRAGFLSPILTDVGDEQSIQKNLSTFSAHVTNLVSVLKNAGPKALVLLDEIATGTDPHEGAALACALVDALCARGAAVGVTTHYERLKAMAVEDERLTNASVGFDVEHMEPTFRVRLDVPGSSSALAVARRFGMPDDVLARAESLLPEESRAFDALIRGLEERATALEKEREAATAARRDAERLREEAAEALEKAKRRDKSKLTEEGQELLSQLRQARAELKDARKALRTSEARDESALQAVREQIAEVSGKVDPESELGQAVRQPAAAPTDRGRPVEADQLEIGQDVYVPRLRAEVTVVEPPSKGRVRVAAGPVKLWVRVDEVRRLDEAPAEAPPPAPAPEPAPASIRPPGGENTLDVRGMRVDDALSMTESFLDRMFGASEAVAYVLHGVGSGALRDAIRSHLGAHAQQYVRRTRPGTTEEGGERMTVVYLR